MCSRADPEMSKKNKQVGAFCNTCRGERNHDLLCEHTYSPKPDYDTGVQRIRWELLKCCGCDTVKARSSVRYLEGQPDLPQISYYPPIEARELPKWSQKLPTEVQQLQLEVYSAINSRTLRLAAMGARALLDMAIVESVGDMGTFQEKLGAMEARGHLASKNRHILQAAFDTGSAAAHRGHNPTPTQLDMVLNIVEHLLEEMFCFPESAKELKQTIPSRKVNHKLEK